MGVDGIRKLGGVWIKENGDVVFGVEQRLSETGNICNVSIVPRDVRENGSTAKRAPAGRIAGAGPHFMSVGVMTCAWALAPGDWDS